jgi:hypothetical protein
VTSTESGRSERRYVSAVPHRLQKVRRTWLDDDKMLVGPV